MLLMSRNLIGDRRISQPIHHSLNPPVRYICSTKAQIKKVIRFYYVVLRNDGVIFFLGLELHFIAHMRNFSVMYKFVLGILLAELPSFIIDLHPLEKV